MEMNTQVSVTKNYRISHDAFLLGHVPHVAEKRKLRLKKMKNEVIKCLMFPS